MSRVIIWANINLLGVVCRRVINGIVKWGARGDLGSWSCCSVDMKIADVDQFITLMCLKRNP